MWRYGHFPWLGGFFSGGILSMLIWALILLALIYLAVKLFAGLKSGPGRQSTDRNDSLTILKTRYARGELSREEYIRMKEMLVGNGASLP